MKLSKVKKICIGKGTIICAQAETGIDVRSWIGTNDVMYPVHDLLMTAELACRIWEVDAKKIQELFLCTKVKEEGSVIPRIIDDLENFPLLGESGGSPSIRRICSIDNDVILYDSLDGKIYMYPIDLIAPVEGRQIRYFKVGDWIGIYGDGQLEAAIWSRQPEEELMTKLKDLSTVLQLSGISEDTNME